MKPRAHWLRQASQALLNTLWPRECVVCGRDERVGQGDVCDRCWAGLLPARPVDPPSFIRRITVAFAYDEALRAIVHRFKFEGVEMLALPLAQRLAERLQFLGVVPEVGILLPVPSHPSRLRERGYNPAEVIAGELASIWEIEARPKAARRVVAGPHQSSLPDDRRKQSLVGAFHVATPTEAERQLPLILFDDVIHTGTTLKHLAKAGKAAGWKRIEAICLCK